MSEPLVSIVMPVRNGARWIGEAVESGLAQSVRSLEIVVVDNGSTDETPQIVMGLSERDGRVVMLTERLAGAAVARNTGLASARGEWIASMDADDLAKPNRLERQLAVVRQNRNVSLVGSGFDEIDEAGFRLRSYAYPRADVLLRRRLERLSGFFPASSAFFPRRLAMRLGAYRPSVGYAEDWDMWLRLAESGRLFCVPEALVAIRRHKDQVSHFQGGRPQAVHAVAATTTHFLRLCGIGDPIAGAPEVRTAFLAWVERRMTEEGYFDQRRIWQNARARFLSNGNRVAAAVHFGLDLIQSGHGSALARQKFIGNPLPSRLARAWASGDK